ncbi:hypothetical protein AXG93_3016s1390 [Marchantia polymorpha subsp. ruderalis]|uniref:Uncharacterized protein n=1 Tax=Marchantia polymorpha subsp. ruderalis TaxID=1480154 RepID=A0A176WEF7_MARPO|nr:hypothetical protein AXG93_3016s1390 [Marchantia polymorpha subsp. ruderalis]
MTSIYPTFKGFQQKYRGVRSSSQYTLGVVRWNENVRSITMLAERSRSQPPFEKRLDDYLYALNERDDFAMSIIFFHGPCNDGEEIANMYFRDWVSICQNDSGVEVLWPTAWLAEDVPGARIFSATYDLSLKVTSREGRQDYYLIGENLLGSIFLHAQDYEMWSKPVVLDLEGIHKVLVPEGSWRGEDCDSYMTADADHFSVCKPTSKTSNNYIDLLSQIEACHYQLRITQHVREAITSVIVSRETSLKKLPSLDLASLVDLKEQLPCYPATALHSQVITQHSRSRLPPIEGNINWYRFHRTLARLNARAGL